MNYRQKNELAGCRMFELFLPTQSATPLEALEFLAHFTARTSVDMPVTDTHINL